MSWLVACNSPASLQPAATSSPPATGVAVQQAITGPNATPLPGQTPTPTNAAVANNGLELTLWTPEFISPKAGQASGGLMAEYLDQFQAAKGGNVHITPVLKAKYGKGGLLDYLRTAQPVAPAILPDIVVLDSAELEQAASLGVLQPLEKLLDPQVVANLYPFAKQVGQFDGHLLAVPFVADLDHLVYNRSQLANPPANWKTILADKARYLLASGNPQVSSATGLTDDVQPAFISQYLSAGGTINSDTRQLVLQEEPLLRVLTFYSEGQTAGVLPPNALDLSNPDDTWNAYAHGAVTMTNVSARQFLVSQDTLPATGYAPLPGWSEPAPPIARSWALGITTTDPARQRAAADFIAWLLNPERSGAWAQAAGWLPVSSAGWGSWESSPYHDFLNQQLSIAVAHPAGAGYAQTAAQLRKALVAVLKDHANPSQAAQAALSQTP